jgi:hypothetical protein
MKRLRLDIQDGARASTRSAWFVVVATAAQVLPTLVMAWPIWFPPAPHGPANAATAPPAQTR